jgi:hypothetical protein
MNKQYGLYIYQHCVFVSYQFPMLHYMFSTDLNAVFELQAFLFLKIFNNEIMRYSYFNNMYQ